MALPGVPLQGPTSLYRAPPPASGIPPLGVPLSAVWAGSSPVGLALGPLCWAGSPVGLALAGFGWLLGFRVDFMLILGLGCRLGFGWIWFLAFIS